MIRRPCKVDTDFQRAITFQRDIEVWIDDQLNAIGKIEKFTNDCVRIDGNYFIRDNSEFIMV